MGIAVLVDDALAPTTRRRPRLVANGNPLMDAVFLYWMNPATPAMAGFIDVATTMAAVQRASH